MNPPSNSDPNSDQMVGRLKKLARDHPEIAVLVSTGVGVVAGVALSSLIESNRSIERGTAGRLANRFSKSVKDSTEGLSVPTLESLRELIKG